VQSGRFDAAAVRRLDAPHVGETPRWSLWRRPLSDRTKLLLVRTMSSSFTQEVTTGRSSDVARGLTCTEHPNAGDVGRNRAARGCQGMQSVLTERGIRPFRRWAWLLPVALRWQLWNFIVHAPALPVDWTSTSATTATLASMSGSREQLEVSSGHAGFALRAEEGIALLESDTIASSLVKTAEVAGVELWVRAGSQWGPYDVVVERLDAPPSPADDEWEDVVELSLSVGSELAVMDIEEFDPLVLVTEGAGEFRIRICARGRAEGQRLAMSSDDVEDLLPVEHFLLQSWAAPMSDHVIVRLNAPLLTEEDRAAWPPEDEVGREAARAIGRDVDRAPGCRALSGQTGSVAVTATVTGTRRRMFRMLDALCGAPGGYMGGGSSEFEVGNVYSWHSLDDISEGGDRFTGEGHLDQTLLEFCSPAYLVMSWTWINNGPDPENPFEGASSFLSEPSVVRFDLTEDATEDGGKQTTVQVRHDGLPVEWLDDMTTYWRWILAIAEVQGFGVR
jgi:hypothetical protein